jgi:hypothetical protein
MHVALLVNTACLDEELSVFRSLVVGLLGEQVRVVQVVPRAIEHTELSAFGEQVFWHDTPWSWLRRVRLFRLHPALAKLNVNVVHALDGRLWRAGLDLGKQLGAAMVMGAGSAMDIGAAASIAHGAGDLPLAFAATTAPLAKAIGERLGESAVVEHVPIGVHLAPLPQRDPDFKDALCAVVTGTGGYDLYYEAFFRAMAQAAQRHPQVQFFFDNQDSEHSTLWQAAKGFDLLGHMSLIPRKLGHRELLLKADVLIQPQPLGRSRTLTLQAMAHGVPILAHRDPWVDYLINDQTAWLVDQPDYLQWGAVIDRLIAKPAFARDLTRRAHDWVGKHHLASQLLGRTLNLYRRLSGEGMKFPAAAG